MYDEIERAFCDQYVVHKAHDYRAVNGNTYSCYGFTQKDADFFAYMAEQPPCEHGLSASLCAGPSHYPMDM